MSNFDVHYAGDLHEGESVVKQACFDSVAFDMRQAAAERDAALAREVALREELETEKRANYNARVALKASSETCELWKGRTTNLTHTNAALQQRLTVAEQLLRETSDYLDGSTRNAVWCDSILHKKMKAALKPAAEGEVS